MNLFAMAVQMQRTTNPVVAGLPSVVVGGKKFVGGTVTSLGANERNEKQSWSPVEGMPSAKVQRTSDGGAEVVLRRNSRFAASITDADMAPTARVMGLIEAEAKSLSTGGLKTATLRKRNHPYGRGIVAPSGRRRGGLGKLQEQRAGVSNMAVVNTQSGDFAKAWETETEQDKTGATFILRNTMEYAQYLALGTVRMKAHGPFTTAFVKYQAQLNSAWMQAAKRGKARDLAMGVATNG